MKHAKAGSGYVASMATVAIVFGLFFGPGAASADPPPISRAETLLFMTPHLNGVQPPSRLHYAFQKSGTLEKGFSDTVDIDITTGSDGKRRTAMRSFASTGGVLSPEFENAETNPVLLFYLDREVDEMKRLTSGSTFHFSKQIRLALAESAKIKEVEIHFGGRALRAQEITIAPYESDPYRDRYPDQRLMAKKYIFTICEAIPGVVYEVRGVVPGPAGSPKGEAVMDETLTFTSAGVPQ